MQVVDEPAKFFFVPDAGKKSLAAGALLLPNHNRAGDIYLPPQNIHPRMPTAQMRAIDLDQLKKNFRVREFHRPERRFFAYQTIKHDSKKDSRLNLEAAAQSSENDDSRRGI